MGGCTSHESGSASFGIRAYSGQPSAAARRAAEPARSEPARGAGAHVGNGIGPQPHSGLVCGLSPCALSDRGRLQLAASSSFPVGIPTLPDLPHCAAWPNFALLLRCRNANNLRRWQKRFATLNCSAASCQAVCKRACLPMRPSRVRLLPQQQALTLPTDQPTHPDWISSVARGIHINRPSRSRTTTQPTAALLQTVA